MNMPNYQRILLATDFSDHNQAPIEQADLLTANLNAKLTIIHVIEPIPAYGYQVGDDLESTIIDSAKHQLTVIGQQLNLADDHIHLKFGSVKKQVLTLADELNCDLIIIGSHGRHGLNHLLGSSAQSIVHHAKCDVLTVRCV